MNKRNTLTILTTIFAVFFLTAMAAAQGDATKQRMLQRRPAIDKLLISGAVGENNQGLLAVRGSVAPNDKKLVDDENRDRGEVYQAIAGKTGKTAAAVGQQRAADIAASAVKGVWLQKPDGKWYQK